MGMVLVECADRQFNTASLTRALLSRSSLKKTSESPTRELTDAREFGLKPNLVDFEPLNATIQEGTDLLPCKLLASVQPSKSAIA